jgi:cardiolipin synthase A/B
MAMAACCLLTPAGCASPPDAAHEMGKPHVQTIQFDNARGPVSANKSATILGKLKSKSGDIDILQKHLALEQAINTDSSRGLEAPVADVPIERVAGTIR